MNYFFNITFSTSFDHLCSCNPFYFRVFSVLRYTFVSCRLKGQTKHLLIGSEQLLREGRFSALMYLSINSNLFNFVATGSK